MVPTPWSIKVKGVKSWVDWTHEGTLRAAWQVRELERGVSQHKI